MKNKYVFVTVMLSVLLIVSLGFTNIYVSQNETAADEDFVVVTSFYPMYIATMNVIGDTEGVTLKNLSEPQTGCLHDFQLTPADMKLLSTADVFVMNGGGIEAFMEEIVAQYPELIIIEACEEINLLGEETEEHNHEAETECTDPTHNHEDETECTDPTHNHEDETEQGEEGHVHNHEENAHAWMSVELYRAQVDNIAEGLAKADEIHAASYLANASQYDRKLEALQVEQEALQEAMQGQSAIMLHCAYEYIAQEYGMDVAFCMDLDEERQVSAGEVAEVLEIIEHEQVSYIFAEELYAASMCQMLQKEADITVIYLDPLTRGNYEQDSYLVGMQANMDKLKEAFLR